MFRNTNVAPDLQRRPPLRTAGLWMVTALPLFAPLLAVVSVQSVRLSPDDVQSGSSSTGTVTLGSASPNLVQVSLFTSDPNLARVPAVIPVPPRSTTVTFSISTPSGVGGCATISARMNGTTTTKEAVLFVEPTNSPGRVTLTLPLVNAGPGSQLSGLVNVIPPIPPSGAVVQLTSSNPQVTVPSSVKVLPLGQGGGQTTFKIVVGGAGAIATCSLITATYLGSHSRALVKVFSLGG